MTYETAMKFLSQMEAYWQLRARHSREDIEVQAFLANANNCADVAKFFKREGVK